MAVADTQTLHLTTCLTLATNDTWELGHKNSEVLTAMTSQVASSGT